MTGGPHLSASTGAGGSAGCGWRWAGSAGLRWVEARSAGKPGREEGGAAADFCLAGLHAKPGQKRRGVKEERERVLHFQKRHKQMNSNSFELKKSKTMHQHECNNKFL
jgi:hypothetical protein